MYLLVLILVLIVISHYLTREPFRLNNAKYKNYRLGDILKGYIRKHEHKLYKEYPTKFKNTIASDYIEMIKTETIKDNNYHVLKKLCDRKKILNNDDIVIHLRLSDAITGKKGSKYTFIKIFRSSLQPSDYKKLFKHIKKIKRVTIIYGFHHDKYNKKLTQNYIDDIKKIFTEKGVEVKEKISGDPDYDFCYMSQSKHFVMSGGGFSSFIAEVVKMNGNKVYSIKNL